MKVFKDLTDKTEDFEDFKRKQFDDDEKLKKYFEKCSHKQFLQALMDIGILIDVTTTYLGFLKPQIDDALTEEDTTVKERRINKFMKDLNERINIEFSFDKDIVIVEQCVLFDGELYLFFNKAQFIKEKRLQKI